MIYLLIVSHMDFHLVYFNTNFKSLKQTSCIFHLIFHFITYLNFIYMKLYAVIYSTYITYMEYI